MHQEDLGRFKVVISGKKGEGEKPGEEKFGVQFEQAHSGKQSPFCSSSFFMGFKLQDRSSTP